MQCQSHCKHVSMTRVTLLVCLAAIGLAFLAGQVSAGLSQVAPPAGPAPQGAMDRLRSLQIERYETLKKMVHSMQIIVNEGMMELSDLQGPTVALYRAEADLCSTSAERIKVYEKMVDLLQTHEAWMARRLAAGRAGQMDVDKAKVATLEAKIELEKLKLTQ
jgi:hypothetical protein